VIWCFSTKKSTTGRPDALYVSKRFGGIDHFDPALLRHKLAKSPLDGAGNAPSAGPLKIQRLPPSKWQFFTKNDLISMGGMGFLRFR